MPKNKISENIEKQLAEHIIYNEFKTAKANKTTENQEFESVIDLLDSVRESKQYEWMSDIRIPEFISHVLTQASLDAEQYFQTRDFVEVYVEDESPEAVASAEATKELLNRTLNQRHLYHYAKYMRAKIINNTAGRVYARCWWEQKTKKEVIGYDLVESEGEFVEKPVEETKVLIDRFNYDVIDPRNVFTDNKYCYSLQQKDWIFIRSEKTYEQLLTDQQEMGYINLDRVKELLKKSTAETTTSKETYNDGYGVSQTKQTKEERPVNKYFDVVERYGKYWCVTVEKGEDGEPLVVKPGLDENGLPVEHAELFETIITFAVKDDKAVLIRFQKTPYIDMYGEPYRPLLRGLCYIHPTYDGGLGDGKYVKELQLAIDDTFNISNDRVMLATFPVLKTKRYEAEENPEIYIEPGHKIPLENPKEDLAELQIDSDIGGALNQMALLIKQMEKVDAIFPGTQGDVPGLASTTATAVAGAEQKSNTRANYKSMTFENTFLTDLYWMIQQMAWAFAKPETGEKLMGQKVMDFNPELTYFYKPVSQAIESEQSKRNKIQMWSQLFGQVLNLQHPDTVKILNYILSKMFTYMGDEFVSFGNTLLNPEIPVTQQGQGVPPEKGQQEVPTNQTGLPQSALEVGARGDQSQ